MAIDPHHRAALRRSAARRIAARHAALARSWQRLADGWFLQGDLVRAAECQERATLAEDRAAQLMREHEGLT